MFGCPLAAWATLHSVHAAAFVRSVRLRFWQRSSSPTAATAARAAVPQPKRGLLTPFSLEWLVAVLASARRARFRTSGGESPEAPGRPETPLRGPRSTDPRRGDGSPPSWSQWRATLGPLGRGISPKWRATHQGDDYGPTSRPRDAPYLWRAGAGTRPLDTTPPRRCRRDAPLYIAVVGAPLSRSAGRRATS